MTECVGEIGKREGHCYQPVYDTKKGSSRWDGIVPPTAGVAEAYRDEIKRYIGSICTRCGHRIDR